MAILKPEQLSSGSYSISGSFSGSFTGDGSNLSNLPIPQIETGSFVLTSSFNSFTGSYNTGSFTGSFIGDGSGLTGIISSSYALTASYAVSASYEINYETSSSYADYAVSSSYALNSSNAVSASFATNASSASVLDLYSITSNTNSYLLFSNIIAATGQVVGGNNDLRYNSSTKVLSATNISATSLTGSLFGTASYATQALSASYAPSTVPSGPFGIADTSGVYTYYTTFSASMAAATSGQTVEMFADITETGSVTVTLKNGVNINGNGHTYTLNNSGLAHALTVPVTVNTSCNILNLNVIRTGSTGSLADNSALSLGTNGTGVINCNGSTFTNLVSGSGILFNTNSGHEINYAVAYAKTTWGAIAMFTSYGAKLNNSIGYGTSGGYGIRCHNGGDLQNCIGVSDSGYGIYGLSGNQSNSVGISSTGNGFFAAATAFNCVGRSTSGVGIECQNGTNIVGCVGISVSGRGLTTQNAFTYNCTGISSSSSGVSLAGLGKSYNITAKSSTSYALWGTVTTQQLYGGTIICNWNNAAGYGIRGNGGTILSVITNCTFNLSNTSAPYLFNDGIAQAITMRGNTYQGGAVFNANLTQATLTTQDNQGNIYL